MREFVSNILHKSVLFVTSSAVLVSTLSAGVFTSFAPQTASALSLSDLQGVVTGMLGVAPSSSDCTPQDDAPETNIIWCGLQGSTAHEMADSLDGAMGNGDTKGHTDIHAVVKAAVAKTTGSSNDTLVGGTWAVGTSYDKFTSPVSGNSSIVVNGKVVATNLQIVSRCPDMAVNCSPASSYPAFTDVNGAAITNVHIRDANWFFDKDASGKLIHQKQTLVHFNSQGVVDFAMWKQCGNALVFKAVVPQQSLVCKQLDAVLASQSGSSFNYNFTVTSTVQNVSNITYTINYGDGHSDTKSVTNGQSTAAFSHTYTQLDVEKTYTAAAQVNGQPQVDTCQRTIIIPAKPAPKSLTCVALNATTSDNKTFTFVANAQASNTAIVSYTFTFGDSSQTITQASNTIQHTYTGAGTMTAKFSATSTEGKVTEDIPACATQVTPSSPLPKTGPADMFGIFALTSTAGVALHQFLLRRKLSA